mgnify:CR=1 FL=1
MKGTPTWLRAQNDRTAFRLLLEHGPLSRTQLGELSGLSKPTAGQMIARLERVGLIGPVGEITGSRGPNAVAYGVRRDTLTGVAVSILADRLQAHRPGLVIALVSADIDEATQAHAHARGWHALRKPMQPAALRAVLAQAG